MSRKKAYDPIATELMELVSKNPSAKDIYATLGREGLDTKDIGELVKTLKHRGHTIATRPSTEAIKVLGLPALKLKGPDRFVGGEFSRSAKELEQLLKSKALKNKMLTGGALAALIGGGLWLGMSKKPEDKYKREVEQLMSTARMLR